MSNEKLFDEVISLYDDSKLFAFRSCLQDMYKPKIIDFIIYWTLKGKAHTEVMEIVRGALN